MKPAIAFLAFAALALVMAGERLGYKIQSLQTHISALESRVSDLEKAQSK
jgi:hypothetical protein